MGKTKEYCHLINLANLNSKLSCNITISVSILKNPFDHSAVAYCKRSMLLLRQSLFWEKKAIYFRRSKERFPTWFSPSSDLPLLLPFPPLRKKNICKKPVPHSVEEMKGKRDWFIYTLSLPLCSSGTPCSLLGSFRFWLGASSSIMKMKSLFVPPEKHWNNGAY